MIAQIFAAVLGRPLSYTDEAVVEILSPQNFVNVRRTPGGPSPDETARAWKASRTRLDADRAWLTDASGLLSVAEQRLAARSAQL